MKEEQKLAEEEKGRSLLNKKAYTDNLPYPSMPDKQNHSLGRVVVGKYINLRIRFTID